MRLGQKNNAIVGLALTLVTGIGFTVSQAEGWKRLAEMGMGWTISKHESGAETYRCNSIESMMEGPAVYGDDYVVYRNGLPLVYSPERAEFYAAND